MPSPVHVVGASGRSGLALCRALAAGGVPVVAVVRDVEKWRAGGLAAEARVADLTDPEALRAALHDGARIASGAHARHTGAILDAAPRSARLALLGSTRRFTKWPDAHGTGVMNGEAALLASGRGGVMLHPTMIYGAEGEDNVQRLAALLARVPIVPLPAGGRALVQPIHQDDVTRCLVAALEVPWRGPRALVIAGPAPVAYADFVRAVARAAGLTPPRLVSVPAWLLRAAAPLTALPFLPRIRGDELRRLLEDKAFPIDDMVTTLGIRPLSLDEGLARTFRR